MGINRLGINLSGMPEVKPRSGILVIVGSARCVWDDLDKVLSNDGNYYRRGPDIMCLNDMVMHFPGEVDHAYSNDDVWLPKWIAARRPRTEKDHPTAILQHTCQKGKGTQLVWPWPGHGTSGLNAVYTGIALGYDQIILAGVPIDGSGHYFDPTWKQTNYEPQARYWKNAKQTIFDGKVKSLSGQTKEILNEGN